MLMQAERRFVLPQARGLCCLRQAEAPGGTFALEEATISANASTKMPLIEAEAGAPRRLAIAPACSAPNGPTLQLMP